METMEIMEIKILIKRLIVEKIVLIIIIFYFSLN